MTDARIPHILIVEDGQDVALALQIVMESAGYRVSMAGDVAGAIALASAEPIDLMLLDLTLPDGSGLDALASLRDAGRPPRITVALTGRDESEVHSRCLAAGCTGIMVKPVPMRALLARVGELLGPAHPQ